MAGNYFIPPVDPGYDRMISPITDAIRSFGEQRERKRVIQREDMIRQQQLERQAMGDRMAGIVDAPPSPITDAMRQMDEEAYGHAHSPQQVAPNRWYDPTQDVDHKAKDDEERRQLRQLKLQKEQAERKQRQELMEKGSRMGVNADWQNGDINELIQQLGQRERADKLTNEHGKYVGQPFQPGMNENAYVAAGVSGQAADLADIQRNRAQDEARYRERLERDARVSTLAGTLSRKPKDGALNLVDKSLTPRDRALRITPHEIVEKAFGTKDSNKPVSARGYEAAQRVKKGATSKYNTVDWAAAVNQLDQELAAQVIDQDEYHAAVAALYREKNARR